MHWALLPWIPCGQNQSYECTPWGPMQGTATSGEAERSHATLLGEGYTKDLQDADGDDGIGGDLRPPQSTEKCGPTCHWAQWRATEGADSGDGGTGA